MATRSTRARRTGRLGLGLLVPVALLIAMGSGAATAVTPAAPRVTASRPRVAPGTIRERITDHDVLGMSAAGITAAEAAPTPLPSRGTQIKVLTAALRRMHEHYASLSRYALGPQDIVDYGIGSLWRKGVDGAGTTVAVIEGWDDPDIAKEIAGFDKELGLPNPQIDTIYPAGPLPKKCPPGMVALGSYGSCSAWKGELGLDVATAHLIAPYARIVISATPADSEVDADAAQQVAPPEMMKALEVIAHRHLADVISISDGTGEITYPQGQTEIRAQDAGQLAAAAAGIPVVEGTGDCGVVQNLAVANGQCEDVSATPDTASWDDSPWITAVGGSVPNLSSTGKRLGPDPLWHYAPPAAEFSEGAGLSSVFARPAYQDDVASITHSRMRSVPDITMDASEGTSEAGPMLAGVLALTTQENGGADVGPINPALYGVLGPAGTKDGIADVIHGNNSAETPKGKVTVTGFSAAEGFDIASGWGTLYAPRFVPSLVAATQSSDQEATARDQAESQLIGLQAAVNLSPDRVPAGRQSYLYGSGFLPGYPVRLVVDGKPVATLTANDLGDVTDQLDPARLGLARGLHVARLQSLLVDESRRFTTS